MLGSRILAAEYLPLWVLPLWVPRDLALEAVHAWATQVKGVEPMVHRFGGFSSRGIQPRCPPPWGPPLWCQNTWHRYLAPFPPLRRRGTWRRGACIEVPGYSAPPPRGSACQLRRRCRRAPVLSATCVLPSGKAPGAEALGTRRQVPG
jgi:hypothetical protein